MSHYPSKPTPDEIWELFMEGHITAHECLKMGMGEEEFTRRWGRPVIFDDDTKPRLH